MTWADAWMVVALVLGAVAVAAILTPVIMWAWRSCKGWYESGPPDNPTPT